MSDASHLNEGSMKCLLNFESWIKASDRQLNQTQWIMNPMLSFNVLYCTTCACVCVRVERIAHQNRVHASVEAAQRHQGRQCHCDGQAHPELELRHKNTHVISRHHGDRRAKSTRTWLHDKRLNPSAGSGMSAILPCAVIFQDKNPRIVFIWCFFFFPLCLQIIHSSMLLIWAFSSSLPVI